jgi:hypothetical protein
MKSKESSTEMRRARKNKNAKKKFLEKKYQFWRSK